MVCLCACVCLCVCENVCVYKCMCVMNILILMRGKVYVACVLTFHVHIV